MGVYSLFIYTHSFSRVFVFRSYCPNHSPSQSLCVSSELSLPQSCSICLESINPVLCYFVLKCPSCHASWFHRDCVQVVMASLCFFYYKLFDYVAHYSTSVYSVCKKAYFPAHPVGIEPCKQSELTELFVCVCVCQRQAHSAGLFFFRCTLLLSMSALPTMPSAIPAGK